MFRLSLILRAFHCRDKKGKRFTVHRPEDHLGKPIEPIAGTVTELAIEFYQAKLDELLFLILAHEQA
ncbi:MAG: hypothetical protein NDJ19_11115 [Ramlibacter sp.]|nr:hypothetical protein [Ramlibacter sp.]